MCPATRLSPAELERPCRPEDIPFATTDDARLVEGIVGQERAVGALRFGVGIRGHGYNLFALGPPGVGKRTLLRELLEQRPDPAAVPSDWCYVHDFGAPERPRALELPAGTGTRLAEDMERAVTELRVAMQSAFDGEEYRTRNHKLVGSFEARQERALAQVRDAAKPNDIGVVRTDSGVAVAALVEGAPIEPDKFDALPQERRERLNVELERVGGEVEVLLGKFDEWGREHRDATDALDRETAAAVAGRVLAGLRARYAELPAVLDYLSQVELDVIDSADELLEESAEELESTMRRALKSEQTDGPSLHRYEVNVLVDSSKLTGAPVVYEANPTHGNLIGRIEHESQFGALITNFTLIKAGALHRAVGGYLILDALRVLEQPLAWDALKQTLRSGEIRLEAPGQTLGLVPTVSLEPAPVPLGRTKLILLGDRALYYQLAEADPDLLELFKVLLDFEEDLERRPETQALYANLVATLVKKEGLRPFDRGSVARVIEQAARSAEDSSKLSMHMRRIADLLREADFWAGEAHHAVATAADVQTAIDAQRHRGGRAQEQLQEAIRRGDVLIDTAGERSGQVNGLSVYQLGEQAFGHPTRITARVRLGKGEVIDIEREVKLGGPIHSKGVLILAGFLGARYAQRVPLSVSATVVFEQSYGSVEGDSASLAELCALLSALSGVPARQSLALTGSVNQQGEAQSIGGVNEKIEGFFDVCRDAGLTGDQGVIIPKSNVKNLMLRRDVVEAVESGRFQVYAIDDVDDAIALLTGRLAGARDDAGRFAEGSVNALVEARLVSFAEGAREYLG